MKITKRQIFILNISFFVLFTLLSHAQITFQKTIGNSTNNIGASVKKTTDGGYIITGTTYIDSFIYTFCLLKTDAYGNTLWTKAYSNDTNTAEGKSVIQTLDGGYMVAGYVNKSIPLGSTEISLIKTDTNGDTLWTKSYGDISIDRGFSVIQTSDTGYLITGTTMSAPTAGFRDIYLIKTDVNGNILWTGKYGSNMSDDSYSVQQTTDGGYIIAGSSYGFGAGGQDAYLIKTNSTGVVLWSKIYGGSSLDVAYTVQQTTDGGYFIAGTTMNFGAGLDDLFLIKTDSIGNALWTKTYGGTNDDKLTSAQQTSDGGFILAGYTYSFGAGNTDAYLIKTGPNGDTLWTKTYGSSDFDVAYSVQQTSDNGFILVGYTYGFGTGESDIYLIKTDANGNSGCNQSSTNTIVGNDTMTTSSPTTVTNFGGALRNTPITVKNNIFVDSVLCNYTTVQDISLTDQQFKIYPNPNTGEFTLKLEGISEIETIRIMNILGQEILGVDASQLGINKSKYANRHSIVINLSYHSAGIYNIQIVSSKGILNNKMVIID